MKIAVASLDGTTVAPSLAEARCLVIFQALGDVVDFFEIRPEGVPLNAPATRLIGISPARNATSAAQAGSAALSAGLGAIGAKDQVSDELVRALLDCDVVLAGTFSDPQEHKLRRLGLLVLPAFPKERAEKAVRFVVSGTPPNEADSCGPCPSRVAPMGLSLVSTLSRVLPPIAPTKAEAEPCGAGSKADASGKC